MITVGLSDTVGHVVQIGGLISIFDGKDPVATVFMAGVLVGLGFWIGQKLHRRRGRFGELSVLLECNKCGRGRIEPSDSQLLRYLEDGSVLITCPRCGSAGFADRSPAGRGAFYEPHPNLYGLTPDQFEPVVNDARLRREYARRKGNRGNWLIAVWRQVAQARAKAPRSGS